ncbi:unnamed protein product [Rotaria sp. Silwood2]|nr:unnamed protein product [Rotaria sp. Silwood2]
MSDENKEIVDIGHRNPDTDIITVALIYTEFLRRMNINAKAYRLGNLNNETKFVLKTVDMEEPEMLSDNMPESTQVALVDHNENIDQKTAFLLISAILSDTLHFRSSTTTDDDRKTVEYLHPLSENDNLEFYVNKLFEAKSDLTEFSTKKIRLLDYKTFHFNDEHWRIGTGETCNMDTMLERKDEFLKRNE